MRKIKGFARLLYHARHHALHQIIGLTFLMWIFNLWGRPLQTHYLILGILCNELIDLDHVLYILWYGKTSNYGRRVHALLNTGNIVKTAQFISQHHKRLTAIVSHNVYVFAILVMMSMLSFSHQWVSATIILGGSAMHLAFDMLDDIWMLRRLNTNWFFPRRGILLAKKLTI